MSSFPAGGPPKGSLRLLKKKIKSRQTGATARRSEAPRAREYSLGGRAEQGIESGNDSRLFQSKQAASSDPSMGAYGSRFHEESAVGALGNSKPSRLQRNEESSPEDKAYGESSGHQPDLKFFSKPAVKWTNPNGQKCIPVRGESRCLCGCRKKVHKWDGKRFRCTKPGCKCRSFYFIVAEGAWKLRCSCKHHATDHDPAPGPHKCKRRNCKCNGFVSPWVCNCGAPWTAHKQSVEMVKFVSVDGMEMPASMFAQMAGIDPNGEGIAPEINRVSRDPKFGERY